jgi:hypothetical protein
VLDISTSPQQTNVASKSSQQTLISSASAQQPPSSSDSLSKSYNNGNNGVKDSLDNLLERIKVFIGKDRMLSKNEYIKIDNNLPVFNDKSDDEIVGYVKRKFERMNKEKEKISEEEAHKTSKKI